MPLNCPRHPETEMIKKYLDSYYCPECDHDWLIHLTRTKERGVKSHENKNGAFKGVVLASYLYIYF